MKYLLKSVNIPLGRIEQNVDSQGKLINLARFNQFADEEHIKNLGRNIKRNGQIEPCCVEVVNLADGESLPQNQEHLDLYLKANTDVMFRLVTGNNRYKACQIETIPTLVCNVVSGSRGEMIDLSVSENLAKPLSPIDRAISYYRLTLKDVEGGAGIKPATVAARHNESLGTVQNYLQLLDLPRDFQAAIHDSDQNTGRWAKENDDWNKLRPTKALALWREAKKYAATVVTDKDDEEGLKNHAFQAMGRVMMQFEKGYKSDSGPNLPAGLWRIEAIWPEGTRPKNEKPAANIPDPVDGDVPPAKEPSAKVPPTIDPDKEPSAATAGAGKSDKKPKGERFGVGMTCAYIIGAKRRLISDFHIPPKSEVALTLDAVNVFLAHLEKMEVGSDEANRAEGEFLMAVKRQAERVEKVCEDLRKAEQTIIELEKLASVPA